jgi:hypothetical protein
MEFYQHAVMRKNSDVPTPVISICDVYFFGLNIIHVLFCLFLFSKDKDFYCVIHVTGHGLFSQAKGRPKGDSRIKPPCSDSMHNKMLELRKDFRLRNETQMMVMLSICTKDMNRNVSMYPEVWFIDCTAGEFRQTNSLSLKSYVLT